VAQAVNATQELASRVAQTAAQQFQAASQILDAALGVTGLGK
jgi:hypothetical protein